MNNKEWEDLVKSIAENKYNEEELELSEAGITDQRVQMLVAALKKNTHIKSVNLANNAITDQSIKALADIPLTNLNLSCNKLGVEAAKIFANIKISELDLSGNKIQDAGAQSLSANPHLTYLSLSECDIGDLGASAILNNNNLQSVNLSNNRITSKGLKDVTAKRVQELNLSQNMIGDDGAEDIAKLSSLSNVNLASNQIGDKGAQVFVSAKALEILNLVQNKVTAKGFLELCKSQSIKILELYNNQVQCAETDQMPANQQLIRIGLAANGLNGKCAKVFEGLASIPSLTTLDLSDNAIDDAGVTILFKHKSAALKINIDRNNKISESTLKKLH